MKLVVATTVLLLTRSALACPPLGTCATDYCRGATAIVEARVLAVEEDTEQGEARITLDVLRAFGDGVAPGEQQLTAIVGVIQENQLDSTVVATLHPTDAELVIEATIPFGPAFDTTCFAADATLDEVAAQMLAPSCRDVLGEIRRDGPPCPNQDPFGCQAGHGAGLGPLVALGILLRRRRLAAKRR